MIAYYFCNLTYILHTLYQFDMIDDFIIKIQIVNNFQVKLNIAC